MKLPDEDKLKQRVIDILAAWDQLLLNDFSGGCWARISPELGNFSLAYVSKSKFNGEHYVLVQTVEVLIPLSLIHTAMRMSPDASLSIIYGLKLSNSLEEWFAF